MEGQRLTQESSVSIPIIPQPRRLSVNPCATQPFRTPYVFLAVTDPEWARSKGRGGGERWRERRGEREGGRERERECKGREKRRTRWERRYRGEDSEKGRKAFQCGKVHLHLKI
jgi:hypothetical protein